MAAKATEPADGRQAPVGRDAETTYEQARDELATVVASLEAGGLTLEQSLALWERGEELAALCQGWLDSARQRVSPAQDSDGPTGA